MNQDEAMENGLNLKDLNFINSLSDEPTEYPTEYPRDEITEEDCDEVISENVEAWEEYCEEWGITDATLDDKIDFCYYINEDGDDDY